MQALACKLREMEGKGACRAARSGSLSSWPVSVSTTVCEHLAPFSPIPGPPGSDALGSNLAPEVQGIRGLDLWPAEHKQP